MKPDHPLLATFLSDYRAKHGIESVQVTASGALIPLRAARAWTVNVNFFAKVTMQAIEGMIAKQNPLKNAPIRS